MKTRDGMRPYNSPDKEGHASTKIEEKGISHHMQKDRSLKEPIEGLPHKVIYILMSTTLQSDGLFRVRSVPLIQDHSYQGHKDCWCRTSGPVHYILIHAYLNNIKF